MPQTDKYLKHRQKYLCSNPNCRRVFSRPKIIKYYVCPTCQTLVDMIKTEDKTETEVTSAVPELVIRRIHKIIKPEKSQELEAINARAQATTAQVTGEERRSLTEEEQKASEKTIMLEHVHTPQTKIMDLTPTQEQTIETRTVSPSSSGCQYGYGYLGQREKGERIPDTCIECPKSLSCMLSEYYKEEKSVKEIKKWYTF